MKKNLIVFVCAGLVMSCSTKRDTMTNRAFHNSTAWFNTLFNAEKEMDKKLAELAFEYQDNYSEILPVDPLPSITEGDVVEDFINQQAGLFKPGNAKPKEAPAATGFDLVEKKALKAIEGHSMLINGVERNKTMTHAYLVLGKARYNKGKGFESLEALNYLRTKLPYHKKYTPEARLYTGLANIQIGNTHEGEAILTTLYKDDGYKKDFKEKVSKHYAELLIKDKKYEEAIEVLDHTIAHTKNKKRRARYHFIEGQLYSLMGMQNEAGEAYTRVFKMKPGFEMEVKSQLGIAANFDPKINRYASYKEHLLDVSKRGNYLSRKNEFYYAIGDMAIKADKIDEARTFLKQSFEGPASDPYIRGKAYERYADLEFNEGNYVHASAYYDSAVTVFPFEKDIKRITDRNESLKFLMQKYYLVKKNDSILKLAHMTLPEKETYFNEYIAQLKIEDAKKQKALEEEATIFQTQTGRGGGGFNATFGEGGNTFYFYNASIKSNGQNEFKRIWGNTRLVDNWRSSAGASMSLEEKEAEMLGQADTQNPRRYELEFYLEQIPTKLSELNKLKIERDTTELSLGIGYYDLFKNDKTATKTLEHLLSTPPKEQVTEAQALYQIYRINNREGNVAKAEEYKQLILSKYPNSIYAEYILNPEVNYMTPTTQEAVALYESTYLSYKEKAYDVVKKNVLLALEQYPSEAIIAKFSLLNALVIGKTEGVENFIAALELITIAYQNTDEAKKAQEILDLLNGKNKEKSLDMGEAEKKQVKSDESLTEASNSTPQTKNGSVNPSDSATKNPAGSLEGRRGNQENASKSASKREASKR